MGTDKPLISILMAVYEPRMDWLQEQLLSLNGQTYPNLKLYVRDDCSPTVAYEDIEACVRECIQAFPYEIQRNEENLGSNKTFERLTQEAEGEYFAYCDQDDVWLPEKLEVLEEKIRCHDASLICSDMNIIDENGDQTADSITKVRRHHVFSSGEGLAAKLLVSNFVTGCTMLINAEVARTAIPFCPFMVHDHFLALWSAQKGKIISLDQKLIRYRIHTTNQTSSMAGVRNKEDYFQVRIMTMVKRLMWLLEHVGQDKHDLRDEISQALVWAKAREANFHGNWTSKWTIWKYRRFSPLTSCFEIVLSGFPNRLFMFFVELKRKNVL